MNKNGQEYNDLGKIIFDGEFLNDEKWSGNFFNYIYGYTLISEGQYINGEISGDVKEYYDNSKLRFEGKYLNGKKMEKGKNIMMVVVAILTILIKEKLKI